MLGGRGCCGRGEEDGREEGAAAPLEALRVLPPVVGDLVASAVFLGCKVVQISQQRRKVTDGVSVICPNNRERLTFVGQDAVGRQRARHGRLNALMKALHSSGRPYTIALISNLLLDEGSIHMCDSSRLHKLRPVLVRRI